MNGAIFRKFWILAIDVLLFVTGLLLAFAIRFEGHFPTYNFIPTLHMMPLFILAFIVISNVYSIYSPYQKFDDTVASLFCIMTVTCLLDMSFTFFFRQFAIPRTIFIISAILQFILITLWRLVVWKKALLVYEKKDAIVIGTSYEIHTMHKSITSSLNRGISIIKKLHINSDYPEEVLDRWISLKDTILLKKIGVIILCASVPIEMKAEVLDFAVREDKTILLVPSTYELLLQNANLISAGDMPLFQLKNMETPPYLAFVKRLMDIIISIPVLLILSPVMLAIAICIKMDSPGPVFYVQSRVGLKEREIHVCKFRTMYQDAEKLTGPALATENDPRITRTGRFLRKTRLDEIPQFWNVLIGEMSLVGPRPERAFFIDTYSKDLPEFSYRTNVKAGITGLAQVEGTYTTAPENKLKYDLFYAQNQSLANDLVILMRTAKVIFLHDKAQ